jgi:hypothetical protein
MLPRNRYQAAGIACVALYLVMLLGVQPAAKQDRSPDQRQDGKVELKIELGTPFYMDGMHVILRGQLRNGTDQPIRIVPPDRWRETTGWDEVGVSLEGIGTRREELRKPKRKEYSWEVGAGDARSFTLLLGRHRSGGKATGRAGIKLRYMYGDKEQVLLSTCEFPVVVRADVEVLKSKDRVVATGKDHPWLPDKAFRVRVQRVRYGGKVYLVSFAFAGSGEGGDPDSANIIDEVGAEADFVLGALVDTDIATLLAYEKGDEVRVVRLSAHSGEPMPERR